MVDSLEMRKMRGSRQAGESEGKASTPSDEGEEKEERGEYIIDAR